jgi:hypothetical protein
VRLGDLDERRPDEARAAQDQDLQLRRRIALVVRARASERLASKGAGGEGNLQEFATIGGHGGLLCDGGRSDGGDCAQRARGVLVRAWFPCAIKTQRAHRDSLARGALAQSTVA